MLKSVQKLSVFSKYQIFNIDFMRLFEGQWLKIAPTAVILKKIPGVGLSDPLGYQDCSQKIIIF